MRSATMVMLAASALFTGCAKSSLPACPPGTMPAGGQPPEYWMAWCETLEGARHGPIVGFAKGGWKLYDGGYDAGILSGHFVYYDRHGEPLGAFDIHEGTGPFKAWHDNGRLAQEGRYKDGQKEGRWVAFHPNGKKALEGTYRQGLENGRFQWWSAEGIPTAEVVYEAGRYQGVLKTFDARGELLEEKEYDHGKLVRTVQPGESP